MQWETSFSREPRPGPRAVKASVGAKNPPSATTSRWVCKKVVLPQADQIWTYKIWGNSPKNWVWKKFGQSVLGQKLKDPWIILVVFQTDVKLVSQLGGVVESCKGLKIGRYLDGTPTSSKLEESLRWTFVLFHWICIGCIIIIHPSVHLGPAADGHIDRP